MLQAKHIAHDLAMDKTTGSRFIKTYCDFQKELWNLGPKPNGKSGFMADEEHERMIEKRFEHSQKILDLREKYYRKYSEFLTPSQISRVYELERKIVNKLRNNSRKARNRR